MFCVEEHKWDYFTRIYIGALGRHPHLGGGILTWGRRVPEAAEKSPDVGRRYRCKYLRISLEISNFTSNSNTL